MKVSLSWLKDYVAIAMDVPDLAEALTMVGLEVESVTDRYEYLKDVVVGRIAAIEAHPNADKLKICRVDAGGRTLQVVCGAPNVKTDMLAPLALPGTVFPAGFVLEKTSIRGQASEGMLCSAAELGLGIDQEGIMALEASLGPGDRLAEALGLCDTVFEFDLTPNRPDCLSVIGVAREIAAIEKTRLRYPDFTLAEHKDAASKLASVTIEAPQLCPRYAARLLEGLSVKASPFWLQDRLMSVGLRPINNIVDVTNFVMMETGQPLHAFDLDRLAQNRIVVRTARPGERFVTLDQKERVLDPEMLMICDGEKPVALAGVMGGLNSEIENSTRRVLIESAYFSPVNIRKTSKKLGLNTDASHRFERGVDPEGTLAAVNRAARLMAEVGQGRLIEGLIDEHPVAHAPRSLNLSTRATNRLLGTGLDRSRIKALLESIEFKAEAVKADAGRDQLTVVPPSFRVDIARPEDLMEEVARLAGYNNIPATFPAITSGGRVPARALQIRNQLKNLMAGFGFRETVTYSFMHRQSCDHLRLAADDPRRALLDILNPLTEEQAVMRSSLVPGLLATMQYNISRQEKNLKIFEIGKTFIRQGAGQLPLETEVLAGLWTGTRYAASWHGPEIACDFYDLKGVVEGLLGALQLKKIRFSALDEKLCDYTRPGRSAQILCGDTKLGRVGEMHPAVLDTFELRQTAFVFELDAQQLVARVPAACKSQPIPRFPAVFRDITLIIDRQIETQKVLEATENLGEILVEDLQLFAVFEGAPIPAGKKSISFRITYRSPEKTLEDEDVRHIHKSITDRLVKTFAAALPA